MVERSTPTSGTIPVGDSTYVDVTFKSTGLGFGAYNTTLFAMSSDPDKPLVNVPVTFNFVAPDVVVTAHLLDMTFFSNATDTLNVNIENVGTADLPWSGSTNAEWLRVNPSSGTFPPGEGSDVIGTFDSARLTRGVYPKHDDTSKYPDTPEILLPATLTVPALNSYLSVVKSTIDDLFRVDDVFTYTLVVSNAGHHDAIGVMLEVTLPDQVTYKSASEGCTDSAGGVT